MIRPGSNTVAAAHDSAPWQRLEELLLGPVSDCQKLLRSLSRAASIERLDYRQHSRYADRTREIVELSQLDVFPEEGLPQPYVLPEAHIAVLRTPTVFLRLPDKSTWKKALPEAMSASLLVWDNGRLFSQLVVKPSAKGPPPFAAHLAMAAVGCDQPIERDPHEGPGRIDTVEAHLLITTGRGQVRDALAANDETLQRLLYTCTFVDPPREVPAVTLNMDEVRLGYEAYLRAVKAVLHARRQGPGYQVAPAPEIHAQIAPLTAKIRTWCDDLPPRLQPFFARSLSLPYRLYWALMVTRSPGETSQGLIPFLFHAVQKHLMRQKKFLEEALLAAEAAERESARQVMIEKLASGPCLLRELLRRYSVQRRAVHQPVLDALIHDGVVQQRDDGRLELCGARRKGA